MKVKILFLTLLFIPAFLYAQTTKDTLVVYPSEKFSAKQLILPTSLIAVGSWGINNGWFNKINNKIQNKMTDWRDNDYIHIDDYIQYLPVASHLGLGLLGVQAKHSFKERLIITATSYLSMGIIVRSLKLAINEKRPDSKARNSFPSGHTATVFMGAELVRKEIRHRLRHRSLLHSLWRCISTIIQRQTLAQRHPCRSRPWHPNRTARLLAAATQPQIISSR